MADELRSDGELLVAFAERRDEAALAVVVERHARLVFNVSLVSASFPQIFLLLVVYSIRLILKMCLIVILK